MIRLLRAHCMSAACRCYARRIAVNMKNTSASLGAEVYARRIAVNVKSTSTILGHVSARSGWVKGVLAEVRRQ